MNDIDIIVGVKDLATSVLDRLSSRVNSIAGDSQLAFAGAAERLNDKLSKASVGSAGSGGNNDRLAKAIDAAAAALSSKLDAAVIKVNSGVDSLVAKVQNAITKVTDFVSKSAAIATVGAAFYTIGKDIKAFITGTEKAQSSIMKLAAIGGATASLTSAIHSATSATTGLIGKVHALGRAGLSAFVLREALKKTETGAMTLSAKLVRVAGFALAADVAARATARFGLSLLGIKKNAEDSTNALNRISTVASKVTAAPFVAVKNGASAAAAATANLSSKIDELPKGAESVNTIVAGFGRFASSIGGVAGLLLSIPAAIGGIALAAVTAAMQTERQLTLLTNKLSLIEAAKLNVKIEEIDTAPLRKVAEETEKIAKQLQTLTNTKSSELISLATSSLAKGLDPSQIGESLKAAVGLAEVYGTTAADGMYRTRQAIDGNFEAFEKLIPAIATMATYKEKLAAVSLMAANGLKVAAKESMNFWGTIEKVKNGLGNTIESLGKMKSLSDIVATVLRDVVGPAVEYLDKQLKGFGFNGKAVLDQATAIGAGVIAAIETIKSNWDTIVARMTTSTELFWVQLTSQTEHFVTTVLP
ncbi:MAG TPA: hypothetical protein VM260_16000, partial [Pirellula sp.]|nr:hypothetical protein [Pirellula sp.]